MDTVVLVIRVVLALVFATAGVAKLRDLHGTRHSLQEFGVGERLARPSAVLLPLAELAVAVGLVFKPTAQWAALGALLLLLVFMAGIANAMRQGLAPDCNCFGQIHSAPAGRTTLIRNGVLSALALVALVGGPGPAINSWASDSGVAEVLAIAFGAAALALGAWAWQLRATARGLANDVTSMRRELALIPPGLPVGAKAPDFALTSVDGGDTVTLENLLERGKPVLLMFTAPNCGPCSQIFPSLRRWQQSLSGQITVALVSSGSVEQNQPVVDEHGLERLLVQEGIETFNAFRIRSTPSGVLVSAEGRIATTTAQSVFEIEPMVRHALRGGDLAAVSS
jgi:methylamine dehydrogenase accessory protein MauD